MPLRLKVEGRVVEQSEGWFTSDTLAARWAEEGAAERERQNRGGAGVRRPLRIPRLRVLERLAEEGRLRKIQVDAGLEVRRYWQGWEAAHHAAVAQYGAAAVASGRVPEPAMLRNLVSRYRTWAASAEARKVRGELTALQLVFDLCVRDRSPFEMRTEYKISNVRALRVCQESLLDYGRLAGWREIEREAA